MITGLVGTSVAIPSGSARWSRFEHDAADADVAQFVDQLDASPRSGMPALITTPSIAAPDWRGLLHQPLAAHLEASTGRIEEQRVELIGAARLEQAGHLFDAVTEDLFGDLRPPPASSAQRPALAAAATILASTVVGVMPASRIGERPVSRVRTSSRV